MVLSGVLAASMAVTGTAAEDQVTITYSLWDEIQSVVYQELIDNFEEQNPNIHVEMQLTPWDQYWTKFDASAGANQAAYRPRSIHSPALSHRIFQTVRN